MPIVTFMSDYGLQDHYVAAVKAAILSESSQTTIVDISHRINKFDISHAAHLLKSVFRSFPARTAHLVGVDPVLREKPRYIAVELEDHFFVGNDSGLFSLVSDKAPMSIVEIDVPPGLSFPCRDILAPIATQLAAGADLSSVGSPMDQMETRIGRQLKATKKEIVGHVIRIDDYGNLITNINQKDFEAIVQLNGNGSYAIHVGREVFHGVNQGYHEVDSGNCFLLFNSLGLLQIGINKGNASELFGLKLDTPVIVSFNA